MEKGVQSYPGQVLAAGGTQMSTGGTKVARGRDAGGMWAGP